MPYRFTHTEKWADPWFDNLQPIEKLLFIYLCDNCDIAGFIEVNYRRWAFDIGVQEKQIIGATKGLSRGLVVSPGGDVFFIRNFLKHQKNYPLNDTNACHKGIIKKLQYYLQVFDYEDIKEFFDGANKGLLSPLGKGKGKGNGNGKIFSSEKKITTSPIEKKITPTMFDQFWEMYPRKIDKGKCLTIWNRLSSRKDAPSWKQIKKALLTQKKSQRWQNKQYIPHPSTWLNQSRWLDDATEMASYDFDENKQNVKETYSAPTTFTSIAKIN